MGDEYGVTGIGFYLQEYVDGKKIDQLNDIYGHPDSEDEVIGNVFENPDLLKSGDNS